MKGETLPTFSAHPHHTAMPPHRLYRPASAGPFALAVACSFSVAVTFAPRLPAPRTKRLLSRSAARDLLLTTKRHQSIAKKIARHDAFRQGTVSAVPKKTPSVIFTLRAFCASLRH